MPGDYVLGLLHECPDEALPSLDLIEACGIGYDRICVEVEVNGEQHSAFTYVGMPAFIDNSCLPSRRYLNILIAGARKAEIDPDYVRELEAQPVHPHENHPEFKPPPGDYPLFDADSLAQHSLYTALYGSVFDMADARPQHDYLKEFFGGRDMTLFHLKRLDTSDGNESMDDIRHGRLNSAQKRYINDYLCEYAREYRYVGRFDYHQQ
jgi:sulfite reductase (NADPH) flavoprotein alpha-component